MALLPIKLIKQTTMKQPSIHPDIQKAYSKHYKIYVAAEAFAEESYAQNKEYIKTENYQCGVCCSKNITCTYTGAYGSVAGGTRWQDFKCLDCGNFTQYESEWG